MATATSNIPTAVDVTSLNYFKTGLNVGATAGDTAVVMQGGQLSMYIKEGGQWSDWVNVANGSRLEVVDFQASMADHTNNWWGYTAINQDGSRNNSVEYFNADGGYLGALRRVSYTRGKIQSVTLDELVDISNEVNQVSKVGQVIVTDNAGNFLDVANADGSAPQSTWTGYLTGEVATPY